MHKFLINILFVLSVCVKNIKLCLLLKIIGLKFKNIIRLIIFNKLQRCDFRYLKNNKLNSNKHNRLYFLSAYLKTENIKN